MAHHQHSDPALDSELLWLYRTIAYPLFFAVSLYITFLICDFIHEAGHARACIALGGNVGGFRHWLTCVWRLDPYTDCSIKPFPPLVWAAGDIVTIISWLGSLLIAPWLLNRGSIKRNVYLSILWGWWSLWNFSTLLLETYHAYASPSVWEDTTQFVHITGINPNLVGIPLAVIIIISLWPWWRIQYRLLPASLLSEWNRLLAWAF